MKACVIKAAYFKFLSALSYKLVMPNLVIKLCLFDESPSVCLHKYGAK